MEAHHVGPNDLQAFASLSRDNRRPAENWNIGTSQGIECALFFLTSPYSRVNLTTVSSYRNR